ncbi:MAG: hypothetical protein U5M53_05195 [Rhodoferax sp.]|nr:hypothetical protein [Rhodoferax sp.]
MLQKLTALGLIASPLLTFAGQWETCDYTVQIERTAPSGVHATVKEIAPQNPAFCLPIGADLRFEPETENYQSMLPRKR